MQLQQIVTKQSLDRRAVTTYHGKEEWSNSHCIVHKSSEPTTIVQKSCKPVAIGHTNGEPTSK